MIFPITYSTTRNNKTIILKLKIEIGKYVIIHITETIPYRHNNL